MIDLKDKNQCPVLEKIGEYVGNPVFMQFFADFGKILVGPQAHVQFPVIPGIKET